MGKGKYTPYSLASRNKEHLTLATLGASLLANVSWTFFLAEQQPDRGS